METVQEWFARHGLNSNTEVMDRLESLQAYNAKLLTETDFLKSCGIIELMIRNPNVKSYVEEWEARCLKAETALSTVTEQRDRAEEVLKKISKHQHRDSGSCNGAYFSSSTNETKDEYEGCKAGHRCCASIAASYKRGGE